MTYCNYVIVQLLTSCTWSKQKSIELLLGASRGQMAPWVKSKFDALMFEPQFFRKQMYYTEVGYL